MSAVDMVYASRLDSSKGEIRLIHIVIHESDEGDPFNRTKCFLQTVSLDSIPEYHALSYEWGSASHDYEDKFKTTINGEKMHLHWNLVEALWSIRKDLNELSWIDSISINQLDEGEKAG
jgi:hypothetical protein